MLLLAPVVAAYAIIFRFAINIPYLDDYWNVLDFASRAERLPSFSSRLISCALVQQDAYKFVLLHAVVIAETVLTRQVNMVVLSVTGDLMLLGLLAMFWKLSFAQVGDLTWRLWLFVPVAYLLFRLNYTEGVDWLSSSLDYVPAMLCSLIALHLLCSIGANTARSRFAFACGFSLLSCFSAPNAVLLAPLGMLVLARKRAYLRALIWCMVVAAGLFPYLYHYNRHSPAEAESTKTSLKLLLAFFLSFLGSGTPWQPAALVVGLGILATLVWAWRSGFHRTHPALMLYAAWLIGSAAMVAAGRSHSGVAYSLASRYKLFSDQLLIVCFLFAADRVRSRTWLGNSQTSIYVLTLVVSIAVCVRADMLAVKDMRLHRQVLLEGLMQFQSAPDTASPMYFREPETEAGFSRQEAEARTIMLEAIRLGLYRPPVPMHPLPDRHPPLR